MAFGYSGMVRTTECCYIGGVRYNAGAVFSVTNWCVLPIDPFFPVQITGWEFTYIRGNTCWAPIWQALAESTDDLNQLNRAGAVASVPPPSGPLSPDYVG